VKESQVYKCLTNIFDDLLVKRKEERLRIKKKRIAFRSYETSTITHERKQFKPSE
jgi:hypothetical protein